MGATFLLIAGASLVTGLFGSLLGLGGGVFLVPVLSLLFGVPMHNAVGASLVAVIGTSCAAAGVLVRQGLADLRLAMGLELATVVGAMGGALLAGRLRGEVLSVVFGGVLFYVAYLMGRGDLGVREDDGYVPGQVGRYEPRHMAFGVGASYVAGGVSGLLGIGGGIIKVPVMYLKMRVPFKVATATSNFMVGVTATAGAFAYYTGGYIDLNVAGPAAVGVFFGASLGARLLGRMEVRALRLVFSLVLLYLGAMMIGKGVRGL